MGHQGVRIDRRAVGFSRVLPALLVLCCGGCRQPDNTDAPAGVVPVPVHAVASRRATLHPSIDLVATLEAIPERMASVSPRAGGWIESVNVVEGQTTQAGQTLVQLDPRPAKIELARTQALEMEKDAMLRQLERGYLPQEIGVAKQEADRANETLKGLKAKLDAIEPLRARNEISPVQYAAAKTAVQVAQATYAAAVEKLKLLEAGTRPERIDAAKAQLAIAQAAREAAELSVRYCTIASPIDGTVTQLFARRGAFVERATPLATIVDLSALFLRIRVPAERLAQVHLGQRVEARLNAASGKVFSGAIARISGQANLATGNIDAFAKLPNDHALLRPGMSCQVRLWLPEISDAVLIPRVAIADRSGTPVVTVVRDQKAYEVEVETGSETATEIQILKGISPGDLVVTVGGYSLPDGSPVRIVASGEE